MSNPNETPYPLQKINYALTPQNVQSFDHYVNSINKAPILTAEEEWELADRIHNHQDIEAAQTLVFSNLRYVVNIARTYSGYGLPLSDLVQEGNVGLMKAVKRYDPEHKVRLMTFATHWVKAEINEYVIKNWKIVKMATTKSQRKLFFKLRSQKNSLEWLKKGEVDNIAQDFNVSTKDIYQMEQRLSSVDVAFDPSDSDNDDNSNFSPAQYMEDSRYSPEPAVIQLDLETQQQNAISNALAELDERAQDIIRTRWMHDDDKVTLKDLSEKYSVSIERIRQLEKQAMNQIKEKLKDYV